MARMRAVYYRTADGAEPVNLFIDSLPSKAQAAIDVQINWLNQVTPEDPPLPFPLSSQVTGELRELRCHYGNRLYRAFTGDRETCSSCCTSSRSARVACRRTTWQSRLSDGRISRCGWTSTRGVRHELSATMRPSPLSSQIC